MMQAYQKISKNSNALCKSCRCHVLTRHPEPAPPSPVKTNFVETARAESWQESPHQAPGFQEPSCPQNTPRKCQAGTTWHNIEGLPQHVQSRARLLLEPPSMLIEDRVICDGVASLLVQSVLSADWFTRMLQQPFSHSHSEQHEVYA